ncbi:hypothetical protein BUALT_Bualt02G0122900 [Buddleja alternifolia]|uniref:RING-type E3 ubiquitin transferase n=1 Tax=Buddleja alternifolia TaxID=168488 RepID=A0AAV6Y047_9LAMI|nr:hypothetical protein BUALT_Bualt02G0122900 [Buddleja alternifolia]
MASPSEEAIKISVALAIDRDKNSQYAVKWAVDNLKLKDKRIILLHVSTQNNLQPHNAIHEESRAPAQSELQKLFLPYRGFCARKGIRANEVILHDLDIASALSEYINANSILTIVLGASNRGAIARAFRNADVPTCVGRSVHDSCTVYVVSKGRAQKIRSASEPVTPNSETTSKPNSVFSPDTLGSPKFRGQGSWKNVASELSYLEGGGNQQRGSLDINESQHIYPWEKRHISNNPTPVESSSTSIECSPFTSHYNSPENSGHVDSEVGHLPPLNKPPVSKILQHMNNLNFRVGGLDSSPHSLSGSSDYSEVLSFRSDISYDLLDQPRISDSSRSSTSSQTAEIEEELRRMKLELKQISEMYNIACREAVTAREKVRDIVQWKSEEASKLEDRKNAQEAALAIVEREKQKCKAAVEITQKAQRIAELESEKRKRAEMKFKHDYEEKQKAMDALSSSVVRYRRYSIDEIGAATSYFSSAEKIGEGGYGPVFKATLDHTPVAIKLLRSDMSEGHKQFQREVLPRTLPTPVVLTPKSKDEAMSPYWADISDPCCWSFDTLWSGYATSSWGPHLLTWHGISFVFWSFDTAVSILHIIMGLPFADVA